MENEKSYLQSELSSLRIECKGVNQFNDKDELEALATAIKDVYFQDYKTAYGEIGFDHMQAIDRGITLYDLRSKVSEILLATSRCPLSIWIELTQ